MPITPIRETTTLDTPSHPSKPGGTPLREVTRLEEPRPKPKKPASSVPEPTAPTAKP